MRLMWWIGFLCFTYIGVQFSRSMEDPQKLKEGLSELQSFWAVKYLTYKRIYKEIPVDQEKILKKYIRENDIVDLEANTRDSPEWTTFENCDVLAVLNVTTRPLDSLEMIVELTFIIKTWGNVQGKTEDDFEFFNWTKNALCIYDQDFKENVLVDRWKYIRDPYNRAPQSIKDILKGVKTNIEKHARALGHGDKIKDWNLTPPPELTNVIYSKRVTGWGEWTEWVNCSRLDLVTGWHLTTYKGANETEDSKGVTGITIVCARGKYSKPVIKGGEIGGANDTIHNQTECSGEEVPVGFRLRSEPRPEVIGDTYDFNGTCNVDMFCRGNTFYSVEGDGDDCGVWKDAKLCDEGYGICGMRAQIDKDDSSDETGLNNIDALCCSYPQLMSPEGFDRWDDVKLDELNSKSGYGEWTNCPERTYVIGMEVWYEARTIGDGDFKIFRSSGAGLYKLDFFCRVPGGHVADEQKIESIDVNGIPFVYEDEPTLVRNLKMLCSGGRMANGYTLTFHKTETELKAAGDDIGVANIIMHCVNATGGDQEDLVHKESNFGLSDDRRHALNRCPAGTFLCGFMISLEPYSSNGFRDNTGINNVRGQCCAVHLPVATKK